MKKRTEVFIAVGIMILWFIVMEMAYQRYNCDVELNRCATTDMLQWCMLLFILRPFILIWFIWYLYHVIIGSDNEKKAN